MVDAQNLFRSYWRPWEYDNEDDSTSEMYCWVTFNEVLEVLPELTFGSELIESSIVMNDDGIGCYNTDANWRGGGHVFVSTSERRVYCYNNSGLGDPAVALAIAVVKSLVLRGTRDTLRAIKPVERKSREEWDHLFDPTLLDKGVFR
nr:MAG TPA: hypothetical protein [Caudoviricetes sp.]